MADQLNLPANVETYADGRLPVEDLYSTYLSLLDSGWQLDVVAQSQPAGQEYALPIIALRSPHTGPAVWILSGIHGEEPAGPNAIAASIDAIAALGGQRAVVLLPLNNPQGYVRNWRYLNTATYSETVEGQSVGDSSHLLTNPENPQISRAPKASSPEADAVTGYILSMAVEYPPVVSIDLHEDNLIDAGYVYSQGVLGATEPLALAAVEVLAATGIPLKMSGETRFGEPVTGGVIGPVVDSSIDELMSAEWIIVDGRLIAGPHATTVLVFETPAAQISLQSRVGAHAALLKLLAAELAR